MRKNQISIKVERFGDQVPLSVGSTHQVISVYADSNCFSDALFEAIHELMRKVEGDTTHVDDVSSSISITNIGETESPDELMEKQSRKLMGAKHELLRAIDNIQIDLIQAENIMAITEIVISSDTRDEALERIQEKFELDHIWKAERYLRTPLYFATKEEIASKKQQLSELNERLAIVQSQLDAIS